jgi:hypothetical protein
MNTDAVTPLRHRMIEDVDGRKLSAGTQRGHIRSLQAVCCISQSLPRHGEECVEDGKVAHYQVTRKVGLHWMTTISTGKVHSVYGRSGADRPNLGTGERLMTDKSPRTRLSGSLPMESGRRKVNCARCSVSESGLMPISIAVISVSPKLDPGSRHRWRSRPSASPLSEREKSAQLVAVYHCSVGRRARRHDFVILLRDVLVGVIGEERRRDDADYGAAEDVESDREA